LSTAVFVCHLSVEMRLREGMCKIPRNASIGR